MNYALDLFVPFRAKFFRKASSIDSFESEMSSELILAERAGIQVVLADEKQTRSFFRLRQKVFGREYKNKIFNFGIDRDVFDNHAKQIVLVDKRSSEVIGGYRIIVSSKPSDYYSAQEFDIENFWELPGDKLELSRACIAPKFRNGTTLSLLWRGVLAYAYKHKVSFICGIPSIKTVDKEEAKKVYDMLEEQGYTGPRMATPKKEYSEFALTVPSASEKDVSSLIPPLMKTYLKAGSKICSVGAVDHEFGCVDFFTVLKLSDLAARYRNKFS